jgi:hypothetical protein
MPFQLSPGVSVSEIDLTTIVPSVSSTSGAFAGHFVWGPVNYPVLVPHQVKLVEVFGKPDSNTFTFFYTASNFLDYGSNLKVIRTANSLHKNATSNGQGLLVKNEDHYLANYSNGESTEGTWGARYPGAIGNSLKVSLCPSSNAFSSNITAHGALTANTSNVSTVVTFSGNVAPYLSAGDYLKVGSNPYIKVASVGSNLVSLVTVPTSTTTGSIALRKWEYADKFLSAPNTSSQVAAVFGSYDELHAVVVDEDGKFTGIPGTVLEKYQFLSKATDAKLDDGSSNYYVNRVNSESAFIWWLDHPASSTNWGTTGTSTAFSTIYKVETVSLTGGVDATPTDADLILSYDYFKNPDAIDVSLVLGGTSSSTIATYLINSIAEVRKDCVVFLSPPRSTVVNNSLNELTDVTAFRDVLPSSSYAVIDNNWKYQFDKYNDVYRWVPMNGDVAGLCVRTDTERDPWFSPGGFNRGQIKNVVKLAWNATLSDRDELYKKSINPIVSFPGEGTILYGDKTLLAKPSAFDRINIRRLFIILEKSISKAAKFSLFEFNDSFTRAQFVSLVEPFLRLVQGRRGITDFKVVCDETNNTGEIIDRNEFVGDIYVKPARSINFIQLNFVATRTGVAFEEVVGKF